jgi:DNA sulfur modification protein DndE
LNLGISMLSRLTFSRETMALLEEWSKKLHLRPNVMARNALMYSLEHHPCLSSIQPDNSLIGGKEMNLLTLLGDDQEIYIMLVIEKYNQKLSDVKLGITINHHVGLAMREESFLNLVSGV